MIVSPSSPALASDDAGWITGQTIVCDGGVSLSGRAG